MLYAVIQVSNGANSVVAEGITSLDSAKTTFHQRCAVLWNAPDVELAAVMIVDNQLRLVNGYHEVITHEAPAEA
jgi:hypothetical protein